MANEDGDDLGVELRAYVTEVTARLEAIDHYALLEIPRDADARAIKRAFFRLAGVLHPDRFFKKRLGAHKAGLQKIFAQLTIAYETLSSAERRASYDASLGPPLPAADLPRVPVAARAPSASPMPPPPSAASAPTPDARQAAMDALKQRFLHARATARTHADAAARARAAGDLVGAAQAYREALRLAPDDAALKTALAQVEREGAARVAESRRKQALLEERYGHWTEAAASWAKVVELTPDDGEARSRLAAARERSRGTAR